jgi:hypothetical protein
MALKLLYPQKNKKIAFWFYLTLNHLKLNTACKKYFLQAYQI